MLLRRAKSPLGPQSVPGDRLFQFGSVGKAATAPAVKYSIDQVISYRFG